MKAMNITSIVLAIALGAAFFAGCSTAPAPRLVYKESQFANRLEYLRFCQHHEMGTGRCD
jgi:PBP1b-binding outer membrane lipoprotein LpoB